jgi:hypothetical protein
VMKDGLSVSLCHEAKLHNCCIAIRLLKIREKINQSRFFVKYHLLQYSKITRAHVQHLSCKDGSRMWIFSTVFLGFGRPSLCVPI